MRTYDDDATSGTRAIASKEDEIWRGASLLASESAAKGRRDYVLDHLGSPRVLANADGTIIGTQSFAPFGAGGSLDGGSLQFTGHERDLATVGGAPVDLPDYMHARYYSASIGRFVSVDPVTDVEKAIQEPQMWNRYAYVTNNPLPYTDQNGKERLPCATYPNCAPVPWRGALTEIGEQFTIATMFGMPMPGEGLLAKFAVRVGSFLGLGSAFGRGSLLLESAIAKGVVREGGALSKIIGGIEAGFKAAAPKSADKALELVAKAAEAAGKEPGTLVKATEGAQYVLQNVGDVKTFIYKTGAIIIKKGDEVLVRHMPK